MDARDGVLAVEIGQRARDAERPVIAAAFSAPRTRSRLSATALSGSPTMVKAASPGPVWICASTARASMPSKATVVTRANIAESPSKITSL